MKTPKILVIGRSGQVASSLREISDETWEFVGRPDFNVCDIDQVAEVMKNLTPQLVINCSAYTAVDKAEVETEEAYMLNSEAAKNLALECRTYDIPLIHISTDYVFDGMKTGSYTEEDKTNPLSVYGKSKLAGEEHIREVLQKYIIIRTSWVFSSYGTNFVKTMVGLALKQIPIKVVNDQTGCPTAAINLARVIKQISDKIIGSKHDIEYGTYHYCDMPHLSWYQFSESIFEILNKTHNCPYPALTPISAKEYKTPAIRPQNSVLDCSLISRNFGINRYYWSSELENIIRKLL